jgi:hypothetical protein
LRESIVELAQNQKIAISVSGASAAVCGGTKLLDLQNETMPFVSVVIAALIGVVVLIAQISELIRKNREHKIAMIKAELEIEAMRLENTKKENDLFDMRN